MKKIMEILKKFLLWLFKVIVKWLKNQVEADELISEIVVIMVKEVNDLNNMTIADLRKVANSQGISLEGKRLKNEMIEVIKEHLELE